MAQLRTSLRALHIFYAVARTLSMAEAARQLFITHSAVSHQIRLLESELGCRVFDRSVRPMRLTTEGEQLFAAAQESFSRLQSTTDAIRAGEVVGELTVSCVPGIAANWLVPRLGEFLRNHSNITVRVVTDYWHRSGLGVPYDLAIIYGSADHPSSRVTLLGQAEYFPVCSPAYLRESGALASPADLADQVLLHEYNELTWKRWFATAGVSDATTGGNVFFDSAHMSLQAARNGYGLAMADIHTVRRDLAEGTLVMLSDLSIPATYPYYLLTAQGRDRRREVTLMEDWLLHRFQEDFGGVWL